MIDLKKSYRIIFKGECNDSIRLEKNERGFIHNQVFLSFLSGEFRH